MNKLALAALLFLAGCAMQQEGLQCASALALSGQKDPQVLAQLALQTPACQGLAASVVQEAIKKAFH